jgi:GPH family glycoside/pentoside/hexuronide:cation symporter
VPLAASWALIFLPTGFEGTALTLAALGAHMLFRTIYTIVSMPYLSLSAVMTTDSNERGVLASFRMIAATGGGLMIAFFTLKLVGWLGGGDQMRGFLLTAIAFGTLATLILWFTFATTREEAEVAGAHRPRWPKWRGCCAATTLSG